MVFFYYTNVDLQGGKNLIGSAILTYVQCEDGSSCDSA